MECSRKTLVAAHNIEERDPFKIKFVETFDIIEGQLDVSNRQSATGKSCERRPRERESFQQFSRAGAAQHIAIYFYVEAMLAYLFERHVHKYDC